MIVKVRYLFSRNDKIGSKLISWAGSKLSSLDNVPSHVAILINNKWVLESTLDKNVRVIGYEAWSKINEELYTVDGGERDFTEIKNFYKELEGHKYDWGGIAYYAIMFTLFYLFNLKMPTDNKFESENKYFCCEVVGKLNNINYSMTAPVQVYEELRNINN